MSQAVDWSHQAFLPGDEFVLEVITAYINMWFGPEAEVSTGTQFCGHESVEGYWITANRRLTPEMIADLHMDSFNFWSLQLNAVLVTRSEAYLTVRSSESLVPARHVANRCGWQPEAPRFLWNEETGTSLAVTERGTLGKGGFGIVEEVIAKGYEAMVQKRIHMPRKRTHFQRYRKLIEDEIENLKALAHPHIVRMIGCYQDRRGPLDLQSCILMWPAGDEDLSVFLEETYPHASHDSQQSTLSHWLKSWFICLASALAYMHSKSIHHEDIKPNNIIHRGRHIYFTDFSSSRRIEDGQETSMTSPVLATRLFAAPEALIDDEGNASRHGSGSDVFSLGLIFFEMLVVLHGHSVEDVRSVLFADHPIVRQYHRVVNRYDWGHSFFGTTPLAIIDTNCVQQMLLAERKKRPSAVQVMAVLVRSTEVQMCTCFSAFNSGPIVDMGEILRLPSSNFY